MPESVGFSGTRQLLAAGPEIDAAVARAIGLNVLGMTQCTQYQDGSGWIVDTEEGEQRPVYPGTRYAPTQPGYACGCQELRDIYNRERQRFLEEHGMPPDEEEPLVFGHDWTCLRVVEQYSADIPAAMDLLHGWQDYDIQRRNGWFTVELFVPSKEARASAETLPLAVCQAVLLAAQRGMLVDRQPRSEVSDA